MDASELLRRYRAVRARTEALAAPLSPEDQQVQAMPEASPVKWHRAHTTWFFETFVLAQAGVAPHDPRWSMLFNSYYETVGPRHERPARGLLSRPSAAEVSHWRREVDARMERLLEGAGDLARLAPVVELGIAHEEQHQELILTDLLAAFARNPLRPTYETAPPPPAPLPGEAAFLNFDGGVFTMGAAPGAFHFDNEGPAHRVLLQPYMLADRLVTVREWLAFAEAGGYRTPSLWLSDGLDWVRAQRIEAPGHARREGGALVVFGLGGEREAHPDEPVMHLSFYEAEALASFLGARLPTEAEWEVAARAGAALHALDDTAWQWTRSSYAPYPGYRPAPGALGEYNGKFMVNQQVLRGGSLFTPPGHTRPSYRNFWAPATRFQATGLRLARDVS